MASVARWSSRRPRVVVTGLGVVSCLASSLQPFWQKLVDGQTGIVSLKGPEFQWLPTRVGGLVAMGEGPEQLNPALLDSVVIRQRGLGSMYGLLAAERALKDAEWLPEDETSKSYTGVSIGRVTTDINAVGDASIVIDRDRKLRHVRPYTAPRSMCNITAFTIGEKYGFTGPQWAPSTACASGANALVSAYQSIVLGDAKVMVSGGADAMTSPLGVAVYAKARALSTNFNDRPELASRPFDRQRDGFVPADGAAVLVLEELNHARDRGARIYAELLGYGMCQDRGTISSPQADGLGVLDGMTRAMLNTGLETKDVSYINAHATATPTGDTAEALGIILTFGKDSVLVASNKGALGHMQGAAGAVEALSSVLSCHHALIPPTVNLLDPEVPGIKYVMEKSAEWDRERRIVISNSFGFGSVCASLVFSNYID